MGSLAVLAMADPTGPSAPGGTRPVHPFFTARRNPPTDAPLETTSFKGNPESKVPSVTSSADPDADLSQGDDKPKKAGGRKKRRATVEQDMTEDQGKPRPRKRTKTVTGCNIVNHSSDTNGGNNRATDPGISRTAEETVSMEDQSMEGTTTPGTPLTQATPSTLNTDNVTKPKKMLIFNPKTGTIGSPPKPKAPKAVPNTEVPEPTPAADAGVRRSSRLVNIRYGRDDASRKCIGDKVNAILTGSPKSKPPRTPRKKNVARPDVSGPSPRIKQSPVKITHPFFAGKGKTGKSSTSLVDSDTTASQPKRNTIQSSTPCSPKKIRSSLNTGTKSVVQFSVKSAGLKFPGQKLPAWPWKDMVHVRGDTSASILDKQAASHSIPSRKSKGRAVQLSAHESLIDMVTQRMDVPAHAEAVRTANSDDFLPPPTQLRLPTKHFESGNKLQLRVFPQLKCSAKILPNGNVRGSNKGLRGKDSVADDHGIAMHPRPLVRLFNSIRTTLSAFDRADCDNISWAQKYAPTSAAEIIQPGQDAYFLKEWLQTLVVQSVDTGVAGTADGKEKGTKADVTAPKKKARKRKKLEGFVVSSDEEASQMEEISDNEHDWTPSGKFGIVKKTVIRAGDSKAKGAKDSGRLTNALLISGPHGCGKTAAVYAVAKELDFDVFEINSSSRRSGKDVDDKIGDMLKHHHVSHDNASREKAAGEEGVAADEQNAAEELAKEIASGKQKTMASFFSKKAVPAKPKQPVKPPSVALKQAPPKESKKEPPKRQKQSLILLDEVDILYDEDKQFWTRVIELIVKSKRPFVMTCNDETLVPLHNLSLHGIFRLSPPPVDLAVDRLLLIAANEGHALRREPVEALYIARNHDLRAATMELDYWCQIGVGDRRGGFDWFYPRWPKGIDLDDNKEVVRVVSEDTYQLGMGWLGRDMVVDTTTTVEEEVLQQSWDLWSMDAGNWQNSGELADWAKDITKSISGSRHEQRLAVLATYDTFADGLSAADICSSKSFAQFQEELVDATATDLCSRSADDYILGLPVLDTPHVIRYDRMSTMLPNTLKSTAKALLQSDTAKYSEHCTSQLRPLDENMAAEMILRHFSTPPVDTPAISRIDFSLAFDPIAASEKASAVSYLDPSVLDRNMEPITLDVAPYVRSIVAYDQNLQQQRLRLSNLISDGGRKGPKRRRTTRAAYSAMEGGSRTTTRADKWFKADLNPHLVMKTAGAGWNDTSVDNGSATLTSTPSPPRSVEESPGSTTMKESPTPVKRADVKKGKGRPRKVVTVESDDELA